ncbi:MAG: hypothetical protein WA183_13885, partial [Chthoniobacterales bacterium]
MSRIVSIPISASNFHTQTLPLPNRQVLPPIGCGNSESPLLKCPPVAGLEDFWTNYNATPPAEIRRMSPERLHFYHDYFSEIRLELRGRGEKYTDSAANRLDLLRSEIARRHSNRRHTQTQWIAGFGIVVTVLGILVGQCRHRADMPLATPPQPHTSAA